MNGPTCRMPSPLDRQFAREHSTNEHIIANLRGLYEYRTKDTIDSIDDYLTKLLPFRNKLYEEDRKALDKLLNVNPNKARASIVRILKSEFTNAEIQELTDLLYSNFTEIIDIHLKKPTGNLKAFLDDMKRKGRHYSRRDIIRQIGVDTILVELNNSIHSQYSDSSKTFTYNSPLLKKLIDGRHIDTFLWLARDEIYKREGIKFGRKIKYVVEFKNDETLEADYRLEDNVKESWMREMEKESPFKNIGQEVRSYLGRQILYHPTLQSEIQTITYNLNGVEVKGNVTVNVEKPVRSKHGFKKMQDPSRLHKTIQEIVVGCRDMNHMLSLLERAAKTDINMKHIYDDLVADSQLADAFYRDFKRTKCNYTRAFRNKMGNLVFQVMKSSTKKLSYYHYSHSFTSESKMTNTIFKDLEGEPAIHGDKLNAFKDFINDNIGGNDFASTIIQSSIVTAAVGTEAFERQSYMAAKSIVKYISEKLGFDVTDAQIEDLIKNKVNLKSFLYDAKAIANDNRLKADALLRKLQGGVFKDRITTMLNNISESSSTSSKAVRIGDSTYFTDIVTSKLANSIDEIKSYANEAKYALSLDSEEEQNKILENVLINIKNTIMQKFGRSSEYYITNESGKITGFKHAWIDALYNLTVEELKNTDNFIYHFTYDRAMLFDSIQAEDFSAELDLSSFIVNFFSYDNEVSSGYARYPVFTTGDSLALKFITAKKYGYNSLINHFISVAKQEIDRMQLEAQVKKKLEEDKYDTGKIVSLANKSDEEVSGDFIYLKFLNRTDVKDADEKTYKERIREALKRSSPTDMSPFINVLTEILKTELFEEYTKDFYNKIKDKELFEISEEGDTYKNFKNYYNLNPNSANIDGPFNGLYLYYLNTKLAYIYQYQFLGANPAAYGLSTAMQKRYKAFNAPGNSMNIWAKDYNGNYYVKTKTITENGETKVIPVPEKVKYFNDTHLSVENTDPVFAESMAFNFGMQALGLSREEAMKSSNYDRIIQAGKTDSRYEMYKDNDATDGQGFRVLESYRRVMGMAKQWTEEMDNAYFTIQDIRKNSWDRASRMLFNKSFDNATSEEKYQAKLKATLTSEEIDTINALDVVFQPIKPHTSTVEYVSNSNRDMLLVPVEHKYAEALIIPELFPENSFRKLLGVEMEESEIDLACSEQCVKVGSFGATNITTLNNTEPAELTDFIRKAERKRNELPKKVKTDKDPFRILSVGHGLDFNISVGKVYNVLPTFESSLGTKTQGEPQQYYILGYEQEEGKLPLEVWFVSSKAPDQLHSLAVSSIAQFIDAAGSHNPINVEELKNNTIRDNFRKAYTHEIDYSDYTIQTNVPEHINALQLFGTQLRKHVFDAIRLLEAYNYGGIEAVKVHGETLNFDNSNGGKAFLKFYNALICENMNSDLLDLTSKLATTDKLSDLLSELKSNDFDSTLEDAMRFSVDDEGNFVNPICEPSGMYDIESILTSIFKREVNKQHINGGSCVQVSDFGMGLNLGVHVDNEHNITTVDCAMSWDLSWTDAQGNKVPLKFSDYCNADGTLIANPEIDKLKKQIEKTKKISKEIDAYQRALDKFETENKDVAPVDRKMSGSRAKDILLNLFTRDELDLLVDSKEFDKEWTYYDLIDFVQNNISEDYLDTTDENVKELQNKLDNAAETKIEAEYPGILELVAYRIPTERAYSILNLKVKRFLPKVMGGVIMVPSQYVTVAGFDFDIDKLYYFRKEFRQKTELSPEEVNKIWMNIYGLKVNEEGKVDTSGSTAIYKRLKEAYREAKEKHDSLLGDEYTSKSLGNENLAAEIKNLIGVTNEKSEDQLPSDFKLKDKLYKYWEEAGLDKEFGMSYTEYFNDYLSKHKDKYIEFDTYDYNKDVTENSVTARNNELIKCIQSRLTSPDTFNARYTPGGFTNAKRDKRVLKAAMRKIKIPDKKNPGSYLGNPTITDYESFIDEAIKNKDKKLLDSLDEALDVTNVLTTAEYNAKNRVASKVIGIMANHNTNAVFSKAMGTLKLHQPIELFGKTLVDLNNSNTGVDYMLTLAELLAASVDAVKDPVLGDLMINSYTANIAALLARLGLTTEEIGLFLNQPIIREICDTAINSGDASLTRAINSVASKYKISMKEKYTSNLINKNDLFESLNAEITPEDLKQGNILRAFASIAQQAQALSDFIAKTKYTAANSIDNTLGGLIALVYDNKAANEQETSINKHLIMSFEGLSLEKAIKESEILKSPIMLRDDLTLESMQTSEYRTFLDSTPFAFEQMVHDAVRAYIKKLGKFFPYSTELYTGIYDAIYRNIIFGQMDQEIVDAVNKQLPVYILSSRADSQFNPDAIGSDGINNRQYYTLDFPEQLNEFLLDRENLKEAVNKETRFKALQDKYSFLENVSLEGVLDNELLDRLSIEEYAALNSPGDILFGDSGIRYNITIEGDGQFDKDVKNSLVTSWDSLIKDKSKKVSDARKSLAHALFMYNFHTRGYEVGRNAFSNITPLALKDTLMVNEYSTYSDLYNKLIRGSIYTVNMNRFIPMFYANNVDNNKLVKPFYGLKTSTGGRLADSNLPSGFVKAELGRPTEITFDGGAKQNYDALTLPNSKRSGDMKGKRILIPAFKIINKYDNSTRLFILRPILQTDPFNFADPNYNVRNANSKATYVEIDIKGISNTTVDYSAYGLNLLLSSFAETAGDSKVNMKHTPYVDPAQSNEETIDNLLTRNEALRLIDNSIENLKQKNDCVVKFKLN